MSFTTDLRKTTMAYLDKLAEHDARIEELEGKKGIYQAAYLRGLVADEQAKREATAAEARAAIKRLTDIYKEGVTARYTPDGGSLTDDAKLLDSGMKLSAGDLERLFDKYPDNPTMQRLISEYAEAHNIGIHRAYYSEAAKHGAAETLALYANSALTDAWRAPFITDPQHYAKITPESIKGE